MTHYNSVFIEQWTEYSLGVVVFLLRIYTRFSVAGWRNFEKDDFLIIVCLVLWSGVNTSVYILNSNISFSSAPKNMIMDEAKYASFRRGTRAVFSSWTTYTTLIWTLKTCWLLIFSRLTLGLRQQKLVKIFAIIVAAAYVAAMTMILIHCIPSHQNWHVVKISDGVYQVNHGSKYVRWTVMNYIVVASMNCSTDLLLISIPLPLLFKLKASIGRKFVLGLLLCSGIFVFIAALLRCIESVAKIANIYNSTIWGIREVFVGICALCAPGIKPLFSKGKEQAMVDVAVELKRKSTYSGERELRERKRSERESSFEKMGITLTHATASRDTLELVRSRPESTFRPPNTQSFTSTRPRPWSDYEPYSPRTQFFQKMPLSVIYSDTNSARISSCSIDPSVLNRASGHPASETVTVHVAELEQVYIPNESGLQKEVGNVHDQEGDVDLEKGEGNGHANLEQRAENRSVQEKRDGKAKENSGLRVLIQ